MQQLEIEERGEANTKEYRIFFKDLEGNAISPFHHIPLKNKDGSVNFVCEIPKYTRAKFEINTKEKFNPISQDLNKAGSLREYKMGDFPFNYGAFPQTFEDPDKKDRWLKCVGDNDPLDAIEVGRKKVERGTVKRVKVLGAIGLVDQGEADWKVIVLDVDDELASQMNTLQDLLDQDKPVVDYLLHWLENYKTYEGKGKNLIGMNKVPVDEVEALKVVEESHRNWAKKFGNNKRP